SVLVRRVVRPLARALPLELGAEALALARAELLRLVPRYVRRGDRVRLVRPRQQIDVEPMELDGGAGHLLIGYARRAPWGRTGAEDARGDPRHALPRSARLGARGGRGRDGDVCADGRSRRLGPLARVAAARRGDD